MRPFGQQAQDVLGADNGEHERLGVPVDRREEHVPTGPHQFGAGAHDLRRVRYVLQHFETGHDVILSGLGLGELFSGHAPIVDLGPGFVLMQLRDRQRRFGHINSGDAGAALRHRLGQDAAAAADIDCPGAVELRELANPVEAQWVDLV